MLIQRGDYSWAELCASNEMLLLEHHGPGLGYGQQKFHSDKMENLAKHLELEAGAGRSYPMYNEVQEWDKFCYHQMQKLQKQEHPAK